MLELRSRIIRNNGDRYFFTRSSTGIYRWVDAATNLAVPERNASRLERLYGHRIRHIRASPIGSGAADAEIKVDAVTVEDAPIVDANDAIVSGGKDAQDDIHYALAVVDMETLADMGSCNRREPGYADDTEYPLEGGDEGILN